MDRQEAYRYLKKYGGIDFLFEHWWTLHTEDPFWAVRSLYKVCRDPTQWRYAMNVYHGSYILIEKIDLMRCKPGKDFRRQDNRRHGITTLLRPSVDGKLHIPDAVSSIYTAYRMVLCMGMGITAVPAGNFAFLKHKDTERTEISSPYLLRVFSEFENGH
jgi:hypothetical protein